eukprot:1148703-Pelagomonas_calceolata.AAC.2
MNSQTKSGNVAKDMMGKIQIHVSRKRTRRVNGMNSSDRKCAPLMICQLLTVHHKLTEVHRVASHNLTPHQVRVCQTIKQSQEV